MTDEQHMLIILAEECAETAQRATKAVRFGLEETQPGQDLTNRQRLEEELGDIMALCTMLGVKPSPNKMLLKAEAVEKYMAYSRELGQL